MLQHSGAEVEYAARLSIRQKKKGKRLKRPKKPPHPKKAKALWRGKGSWRLSFSALCLATRRSTRHINLLFF